MTKLVAGKFEADTKIGVYESRVDVAVNGMSEYEEVEDVVEKPPVPDSLRTSNDNVSPKSRRRPLKMSMKARGRHRYVRQSSH